MKFKGPVKFFIFFFLSLLTLFILLDLAFSDFGPGETQQSRLSIVFIVLLLYLFILYFVKKKLN